MDEQSISVALIASTFALLAGACLNQNLRFSVIDTETDKSEIILIAAKQRHITVSTKHKKGKVGLARSADALSQAAASGNLKITQQAGGNGVLKVSDDEAVTSIAFRT